MNVIRQTLIFITLNSSLTACAGYTSQKETAMATRSMSAKMANVDDGCWGWCSIVDTSTYAQQQLIPIYRLYNGFDHLYSKSPTEGTSVGYHLEGFVFNLTAYTGYGYVPLMRCYIPSSGDHFLSRDPNCEGQTVEGSLGNINVGTPMGMRGILERFYLNNGFHLATVDLTEGYNNGRWEGTLGGVF